MRPNRLSTHVLMLTCGAWLLCGCPLEPLTVTGFGVSSQIRPGGAASTGATVAVSVPGLQTKDASGLTAKINGVPVPILATTDGGVTVRLPPGQSMDTARFELWRNGEQVVNRDIAAQLAQGVGLTSPAPLSPAAPGPATATSGGTTVNTGTTGLPAGVNITINVPAGSTTSGNSAGSGVSVTGTATPTPVPTATAGPTPTPVPDPTPTPVPTPTPLPTLVPVGDQTPVPPGTGEVQGNVAF